MRTHCLLAAVLLLPAPCSAKIWTDISGRSIDAEYQSCDGKTVILKSKASGKEVKVPLERLSLPDKATALLHLHEQKATLAAEAEPPAPAESAKPDVPGAAGDQASANSDPAMLAPSFHLPSTEEELNAMIGDTKGNEPLVLGRFTAFAQPLKIGQYGEIIHSLGWAAFLLGLLFQILLAVLIAAVGIHITSLFLDFKETFGTATMVAMGSTGFRALIEFSQAVMAGVSPSLLETLGSPLARWLIVIGVIYPFDAFLIRRIYRAELGTAMRAAVAYVVWGRLIVLLIGVLLAAAATSGSGGVDLPPGLGK